MFIPLAFPHLTQSARSPASGASSHNFIIGITITGKSILALAVKTFLPLVSPGSSLSVIKTKPGTPASLIRVKVAVIASSPQLLPCRVVETNPRVHRAVSTQVSPSCNRGQSLAVIISLSR